MPELDCFLQYRIDYGTLQPCLCCQQAALLRGILRPENPTYIHIGSMAAELERTVVLKWFYLLSRRKTFVGDKCALLSALLVYDRLACIRIYSIGDTLDELCLFLVTSQHDYFCQLHIVEFWADK